MEDESGGGDGAAWFGDRVWIDAQIFHGLANFVFGDRNNVVDVSADVLEVDRADALGTESVRECAGDLFRRELNDFALTQAGLGVGSDFGFYADNSYFWISQFDGGGDAGDKASTADGGENCFHLG